MKKRKTMSSEAAAQIFGGWVAGRASAGYGFDVENLESEDTDDAAALAYAAKAGILLRSRIAQRADRFVFYRTEPLTEDGPQLIAWRQQSPEGEVVGHCYEDGFTTLEGAVQSAHRCGLDTRVHIVDVSEMRE